MARFYGTVKGRRGIGASRLGDKSSGLRVTANGWDIGGRFELSVDAAGQDVVRVYITSGSNGKLEEVCLGYYRRGDGCYVSSEREE